MRAPIAGFALAVAVLAAAPAVARPFYIVKSGADSWTIMDPDGIERNGDIAKATVVRVQRNILSGDPPEPGYVRTLTEYDCAQNRTVWREVSAFSRAGKPLLHTVNPKPDWAPTDGDNEMRMAWRVVCQGGGGDSVVSADSVAKVVIALMSAWDRPASLAPQASAPASAAPPKGKAAQGPKPAAPPAKPAR